MLEQLQQSLEPILETHGLWLALGLLLLVLVPTLVLFFLRIQQRQGLNTQLQDLLDASGVLYSRLSALDHNLHQYQAQAEAYTGKTQIQVQPLLAPLSENLAQLHRCKVQIKEWEASLGEQEAETAEQEWQALETEALALFAGTEKIEGFFKRLSEVESALQNQLKQIHALLVPYQDRPTSQTSLASLKKRLEDLESNGPAPDPLMDLEGIRKLLQDVNHWVEAEKQANLAAEEAAKEAAKETLTEPDQPLQTPIAVETGPRPVLAPEEVLTPEETALPLAAEAVPEKQTSEEIPEQASPASPADVVAIDQVLDEALEITQTEVAAEPEIAEPEIAEPEIAEPETTEPEITEPEITEPEITEPQTTEPNLVEQTVAEPGAASETQLSTTDKTKDPQAKIEARLLREEAFLAQQQSRFLPHLEEIEQSLTERFVASLWESSEKQLKRALYKAEEAELLFKLAQRLHQEPAAPTHRVLLNLQRSADKWPEIEKLHLQLQNQHQELELAAEQTLQDCRKLLTLLELPEFDSKKDSEDYQVAQRRLEGVITQFESAQALDLAAAQTDLAWVAHCIQSWKVPSNPEEESMVAL
ncbi:MAG: hypothetical protein IV090_04505 [Candidatus Sericytochromatia bacterium]|nr:hypothetical protein [Candidatus Sericytochromatia bacterium]